MLDILLYLLYTLMALVAAVLVLPTAIRLAAAREESGSPPDLGGAAALALGLIGVTARGRGNRWELRLHLLGITLPHPVISWGTTPSRGEIGPIPTAVTPEDTRIPPAPASDREEQTPPPRSLSATARRGLDTLGMVGPPALTLIGSLPAVLRFRRGRISGHYGFPDPGHTGRVMGVLQAAGAHTWKRLQVRLQPDWINAEVRVRGEVLFHFHLGLLLFYVIRCAVQVGWRWLAGRVASWAWVPGAAR